MWCGSLPAARAELGDPGEHAKAEPERREQPVEQDEGGAERGVPDGPAPLGHRRLGLHTVDASRRSVTTRMMRCEISSIESSLTSITGHPSRRWMRWAYSSSS